LASLFLLALARSLNSSSALLASPSSALFTSFFRANSSRDAHFVRPPSRYAVSVFWTLLMMSPRTRALRFGRPFRLPETPFLNRECVGGLREPDLLIARTLRTSLSGERPG